MQGDHAGVIICTSNFGVSVHCGAHLRSSEVALPSTLEQHKNGELHIVQQ